MNLGSELAFAGGRHKSDCHFLAYRFEPDTADMDAGESFIMCAAGGNLHSLWLKPGWLTGLWRSDAGRVYVSDIAGGVHMNDDPEPRAKDFRFERLAGGISGVWGVSDQHVWAWGQRGADPVLHFWDGARWRETEDPGFIVAMHGLHPGLVMAVGRDGLIARWNGERWHPVDSPTRLTLSDVFLASDHEMYACAPNGEILRAPGPTLVDFKPNIRAKRFDARHQLLISAPDAIAQTTDGSRFVGTKLDSVQTLFASQQPSWDLSPKYRDTRIPKARGSSGTAPSPQDDPPKSAAQSEWVSTGASSDRNRHGRPGRRPSSLSGRSVRDQ